MAPVIAIDLCGAAISSLLTACGSAVAPNPAKAATRDAAISVLSSTLISSGQTDRILGHRIELRRPGMSPISGKVCPDHTPMGIRNQTVRQLLLRVISTALNLFAG